MEPEKTQQKVENQEVKKEVKKKQINPQKKKKMIAEWIKANKDGDRHQLKKMEGLLSDKRKFWPNQPTLRDDMDQDKGNVEGERKVQDVRKQPLELPEGLEWCEININDEKQLDELYTLLTNHYVEDDDNTFRFDYCRQFLKWALSPPGFQPKWLVGVRNIETKQLQSSITGVPVHVFAQTDKIKMCQINFLCVHKSIRDKSMAAILIAQVTRRVNLKNKWQAIYTSGKVLPTPFTEAIYYHRSLNPKKLVDIGFSGLAKNHTIPLVQKLYKLPEEATLERLRPMGPKDVAGVAKLINDGLSKYIVKFHYTQQQIKHYFLPRENVVYTYVIDRVDKEGQKKKKIITDVLSFYSLPSHVMKHHKHKMLNACYSFMNFATSVPYEQLINNALILAKMHKYDVYNCLNLMQNATVFEKLHFQRGDGHLNYYFYNWVMECKHIKPQELGVVLF